MSLPTMPASQAPISTYTGTSVGRILTTVAVAVTTLS